MADPFSILAGAAGLADICVRTINFLNAARVGFRDIDQDIEEVNVELKSLQSVNSIIRDTYEKLQAEEDAANSRQELDTHWKATNDTLNGCRVIVGQIEELLLLILNAGNNGHHKIAQFRKWLKHEKKEKEFDELRKKLAIRHGALQLILEATNILVIRSSQATSDASISSLSASLDNLGRVLTSKIESLHSQQNTSSDTTLEAAIQAARKAADIAYVNEHFFIPSSVSSSFIGREKEFEILKENLIPDSTQKSLNIQKRFVLYGLAGSGKTQTCCKFALNHRNSFWGIFWLNASSKEHLKQSFISLSEIPRVAPNEAAVKGWLSSLGSNRPWLLIIDNADDAETLIEQSFPDNVYGSILITTRNHSLRTQGTVGPRYLEFSGLDEAVSINLLLRLADEISPWTVQAVQFAQKIAKVVGCLPLALTYAGKTIASQICTLQTYLEFYQRCWTQLRKRRDSHDRSSVQDASEVIYSSYEVLYQSLAFKKTQASEDALDLLRILPFLDRQNIKLEIFVRAATNPTLEKASSNPVDMWQGSQKPRQSWSKMCKDLLIELVKRLSQLGYRSILPKFLCTTEFDQFRIREAINELLKLSLISMSSVSEGCYTMHPAVHFWARQRPEMTLADQAIWCQITSTILSQSILLPPLDDTEEGEAFRRDLLPHVAHVQKIQQEIDGKFAQNRRSRQNIFPIFKAPANSEYLIQCVKFSLVYYQGHRLQEAERLQAYVVDFLKTHLGLDNVQTIGALRLLSRTYFQLARMDEAVELQKKAYNASLLTLGEKHPETLQVMDQYASALWLQGQFQLSRAMHTSVVKLLTENFGDHDILTLKAMGGLGRALCKDFAFAEAIEINSRAFRGLKTQLGSSHSATLEAMDNLAMSYFDRTAYRQGQPGDLDRAVELQKTVFETRLERLGKEHYHTLWAGLNLARIKAIRGDSEAALAIFLPGRAVVRRDMEPDHFLSLFTELHHARILMCATEYVRAEQILTELLAAYTRTKRIHPDRLLVYYSLIKCRRVLGKVEGTDALFLQLINGVEETFGPGHPAVNTILDNRALSVETSDVYDGNGDVVLLKELTSWKSKGVILLQT